MSDAPRPEVTRSTVQRLWDEAIEAKSSRVEIHRRAASLLDQVNAENPVVNWGLTELHRVTGLPGATSAQLVESRVTWLSEIERFEADPGGWMRSYFQRMVREFAEAHGVDRGRVFAAKLVRGGQLRPADIPAEVQG